LAERSVACDAPKLGLVHFRQRSARHVIREVESGGSPSDFLVQMRRFVVAVGGRRGCVAGRRVAIAVHRV